MLFADGSDDESGDAACAVEAVCQKLFVELMKLRPSLPCSAEGRSQHRYWRDSIAGGGAAAGAMASIHRKVALVTGPCGDVSLLGDVVRTINAKLRIGKFCDAMHHSGDLSGLQGSFDVLILAGGEKTDVARCAPLVSGGLLAVIAIGSSRALDGRSAEGALDEEEWEALGSLVPSGGALRLDSWRRRLCRRNPQGAMSIVGPLAASSLAASSGDEERAGIAQCCVPLSAEERRLRVLSDPNKARVVKTLQEHGLVILPGFVDKNQVLALGTAFTADMSRAAQLLQAQGLDILTGRSDNDRIDNYHELAMREALRCDLRSTPAASALLASGGCGTARALACADLLDALQQAMNPPGGPDARGNWGRWNFEGDGPDLGPPQLREHPVGCVMSLPGCADQTLHTDTPHLQVCSQLPPHYLNLFMPAGGSSDLRAGQTAFVLGSHSLQACADIMVREGGDALLLRRLVRPHLCAGDALLFDARILHFGLANQTRGAAGEPGVWRPILYANVTQAWFADPKNWDDRRKLFA